MEKINIQTKRYLTKNRKRQNKIRKTLIVLLVILTSFLVGLANYLSLIEEIEQTAYAYEIEKKEVVNYEIKSQSIREVTAYNVGDRNQTDSTPCIGAYSKVNLCEVVAQGVGVCATNFVPLGTKLIIEANGGWSFECIVWDRMNSKHSQRVDIAMNLWEYDRAVAFGLQRLNVKVLK